MAVLTWGQRGQAGQRIKEDGAKCQRGVKGLD